MITVIGSKRLPENNIGSGELPDKKKENKNGNQEI